MLSIEDQLNSLQKLNSVVVPDLWQQQAVSALREGKDVIVQAPTGSGKTLIFEIWSNNGRPRSTVIYTVPTRALANDKLAEWRARGWDVGIATGDLSDNLGAPILVATLETQKQRLIRGEGPSLLVVDEYQMLGDSDRGLNYELALALAPSKTQLLLLSGSVANPQDIVKWLKRLGRNPELIRHDIRPVPLDEVDADHLSYHVPPEIRNYWPRLIAKALAENLGPVLIFAPRRQAAEALATELARNLPIPNPLSLSLAQKQLAGEHLSKLLKARVTYHHSGLSYGVRAGVIEPLAKAGQLRVVVATMGLAAGINFSLRSVALAGESYRREFVEQPLRADEILQMIGRAGRRGIDETGYFLMTANQLRIRDGYPCHLSRCSMVDWSALLSIMASACDQGKDPFKEAVRVQERLFTAKPIFLGVEESLKNPVTPCGLMTDAERARHVRKKIRQMMNSEGQWQPYPESVECLLKNISVFKTSQPMDPEHREKIPFLPKDAFSLAPALTDPTALERVGQGSLTIIESRPEGDFYGRCFTVAERLPDDQLVLVKWVRRMIGWHGRQVNLTLWRQKVAPLLEQKLAQSRQTLVRFNISQEKITAWVGLGEMSLRVPVDQLGVPIWRPKERHITSPDCASCPHLEVCRQLSPAPGTAMLWRRLGLIDPAGNPTPRGRIVSFFTQGDGLAVAAGLEEADYPINELIYDLANLDASFRFCGDDNRWGGRLGMACQRIYGLATIPGYLENGIPPKYGCGAEAVVAAIVKNPAAKQSWLSEQLGVGDIDRVIIEWRSLLRQISHAPDLDWPRWLELKKQAKTLLNETESPTLVDLPPLEFHQTRRLDHQLILRQR